MNSRPAGRPALTQDPVPHDHTWTLRAIGYDEAVAVREMECQACGGTTFVSCG